MEVYICVKRNGDGFWLQGGIGSNCMNRNDDGLTPRGCVRSNALAVSLLVHPGVMVANGESNWPSVDIQKPVSCVGLSWTATFCSFALYVRCGWR